MYSLKDSIFDSTLVTKNSSHVIDHKITNIKNEDCDDIVYC